MSQSFTDRAGDLKRLLQGHRSIGCKLSFTWLLIDGIKASIHSLPEVLLNSQVSFSQEQQYPTKKGGFRKTSQGLIKCNRQSYCTKIKPSTHGAVKFYRWSFTKFGQSCCQSEIVEIGSSPTYDCSVFFN